MHIIIAGATPLAILLAKQLKPGHAITIIDSHRGDCDFCREKTGCETICGSPREADVLEAAGISHAKAFISTLHDDSESLAACIAAKKFKVNKVISIPGNPALADAFEIAGARVAPESVEAVSELLLPASGRLQTGQNFLP